jgi:hypothetical protein
MKNYSAITNSHILQINTAHNESSMDSVELHGNGIPTIFCFVQVVTGCELPHNYSMVPTATSPSQLPESCN